MFGLKLLQRKRNSAIDNEGSQASSSEVVEKKLPPKSNFTFRIRLAFVIGESSIQMVAVARRGKKCKLLDIQHLELPTDLTNSQSQSEHTAKVVSDFIDRNGGHCPSITISISGKQTAYRSFLMPVLSKHELDSAIRFEAQKQLPFPVNSTVYDYRCISRISDDKRQRYRIALYASTIQHIEKQLAPFKAINHNVSEICHTHSVMGQLLQHLPHYEENGVSTLLVLSRDHCEISFYRGSSLEFFHIGNTGSAMFENAKTDESVLAYFALSIIEDVNIAHDYYTGQYAGSYSNSIFIYSDSATPRDLPDVLTEKTAFRFTLFPVSGLDYIRGSKRSDREALPSCLPAIAAATNTTVLPNLLPVDAKSILRNTLHSHRMRIGLALTTLILATSWFSITSSVAKKRDSLHDIQQQVAHLTSSDGFGMPSSLRQEIALERAYIDKVKEKPSHYSASLKELSLIVPSTIRLTRIELDPLTSKRNFIIQGIIATEEIPPEIILAEFISDINASSFFSDIQITRHVKRRINSKMEMEFSIEAGGIS